MQNLDFPGDCYFGMVDDFISLSQRCSIPQHHCSHYSSFLRDFQLFSEDGRPLPQNVLGPHPLGVWPQVLNLYSSQCPIVLTFFATIQSTFRTYLETHSLKIIGVALATRECVNGKNYFLAIILGKSSSPYFACSNCNQHDCRNTQRIELYARSLHCRNL